ncbi:MAG: valine--tRNA ligase [Holosporales bacterium]|jgi:valyl-tRNA synthetase|nr:valine--tRNA ligase [Holosporales bacterium]
MLEKVYDPKKFEKEVYEATNDEFYPGVVKSGAAAFSVLMPPPNVTGSLHVGHALTYTIQDILIRYHRCRGFDTLWQPGTDHAGIATQLVVSRELEASGVDVAALEADELISKIWGWKEKSGEQIVRQQMAMGCSAPWSLSRFTMDEHFSKAVIEVFVRLYKDGLIFREKRLVNWDTKLRTAISDLEIQNKEEKGTLWHIKYELENSDGYITIATTRPETMFGDTAVAVHPLDQRYVPMVGKRVRIPYTDRTVPIICDEYIDMEKGTGCLKVTPAHDVNDFAIGKRHSLEMITVIGMDGHMKTSVDVPEFLRGLYLKKARKILLEKLEEDGLLATKEEVLHTIPYGDRSGTVIEPLLTDQWFVDSKTLAGAAINVVEDGSVCFYPKKWENTYFNWMRNIEPWCISRQIVWGHRIPAWYGPSGEIFVERTEEEAVEAAMRHGIGKEQLRRETDVLDTWFSSALWPFVTLGWPNETEALRRHYPTSVLVTGFDIIFFWIARMLMMSLYFMKKIPFKDIYIHALVRDTSGQKMSKSKGNIVDPLALMEEFGADALRFTLAFLSVPGRDIKLGVEHVKISRNFITKIWNAARFLQTKGIEFVDAGIQSIGVKRKLNHWIIAKLNWFKREIAQDFVDYRFDYATRNIQFFVRDTFCDFFIEAIKFQDDDETRAVAASVFANILVVAHPFMPFVTDHLADVLGISKTLSVGLDGYECDIETSSEYEQEVDSFVELIHKIRSERQEHGAESAEYLELRTKLCGWPGELRGIAGIVR